jgi:hypothetical protein
VAPNHSSSADQVSPAHGWLKFGRATGCVAGKVQPPQPPRCVQQPAGEKIAMARIVILARIGVWPAVLGIIVLSVLPGNMRPDVLGNKAAEHFIAYFIANSLFAIRYLRPWQWLSSGVLFVLCAGGLEFIQLWIPGRNASASDFAASALGAWIALLVIVAARRAHKRAFDVS